MSYIGNPLITAAFVTDQFSGTGSQTVYTTSVAPAGTAAVLVSVSGVLQDPSTYSVSGTTLTFTGAPPTGTGNISCRYLGIPASGVTTTAYRTVTEFTATASQTVFTPPSYTAGYINVYRNGVRLGASDFTATNGTTVTLASGASAGDLVVTESYYVSSVIGAIPATAGAVNNTYLGTGAVQTANILDANVTPAKLSQPFTSGTAVASTSGTSIDFTSIPSWVKRVTIMFVGVSTSSTSNLLMQIGNGSVITTGYDSAASSFNNLNTGSTSGFLLTAGNLVAGSALSGSTVITLANSSTNLWVSAGNIANTTVPATNGASHLSGGNKALSGTLDRVRITTVNGTDTFDAGSINILYE